MVKLYDAELSGNCYKVRLFLSVLGVEHELVSVDMMAGEHKSSEFLRLNRLGQVPLLSDGDAILRDSPGDPRLFGAPLRGRPLASKRSTAAGEGRPVAIDRRKRAGTRSICRAFGLRAQNAHRPTARAKNSARNSVGNGRTPREEGLA